MRLTPGAEAAWMIAAGEAAAGGHGRIEPAHLLIGVLSLGKLGQVDDAGVGVNAAIVRDEHAHLVQAVTGSGLDPTQLRRRARAQLGKGPVHGPPAGPLSRSLTCKAVFAAAEALAGERPVGVADLFAALADDVDAVTTRLVRRGGVEVARLRAALLTAIPPAAVATGTLTPPALAAVPSPTPTLDRFGRDLTALARRGELGPVVGRRREILAVLQVLARARQNNPLLVGESGVGKTAIVESIAIRAAEGRDPVVLGGTRIVELRADALLGGNERRAALEERLKAVIAEARANPHVILFVDEIEAVLGEGGAARPARRGPTCRRSRR